MLNRDKWWVREIERINRQHAAERAELLAVVAHLAGRPLPQPADTFTPMFPDADYEHVDSALDLEPED